jgi:hypothetical protein
MLPSSTLALAACVTARVSVEGVVVDERETPVALALVRLQGTEFSTSSDASGAFRLSFPAGAGVGVIAAHKEGHYIGGQRFSPGARQRIRLELLPPADERPREWVSAQGSDAEACGRCHGELSSEWAGSAHAKSATSPLFLAAYGGTGAGDGAGGTPAYRRDFPNAAGNCATCHVPALALDAPFAARPDAATGTPAEGVLCDFCHKVRHASVDPSGGRPGVLSLDVHRGSSERDVLFGPLDDVVERRDSYLPLYRQSTYCAPCHNGTFWNVRAYSEFEEWAASSYAEQGVQCQDCHMRAPPGPPRRMALAEEGGILRDPATLSSHALMGEDAREFRRSSVALSVETKLEPASLSVRVSVENVSGGHHVPTGSPLRHLLLLVEVADAEQRPLALLSGGRVPMWGGEGTHAQDYAGRPGKGFAKILRDVVEYPADRRRGRSFEPVVPAPYWRPTSVVADTRIPAGAIDVSSYDFALGSASARPFSVKTRLIYRRVFRSWVGLGAIEDNDLELAVAQARVP